MTDHARPPEGVETWTITKHGAHGFASKLNGIRGPQTSAVEVVRLSVFLAEREARERAEQRCPSTCGIRIAAEHLNAWLGETRAERDAAVARAEQAERSLAELQECYTDLAKRAGCKRAECVVLEEERDEQRRLFGELSVTASRLATRAEQTEAERDELRKKLREGNDEGTSTTAEAARSV